MSAVPVSAPTPVDRKVDASMVSLGRMALFVNNDLASFSDWPTIAPVWNPRYRTWVVSIVWDMGWSSA